jgi:hypothetical protein
MVVELDLKQFDHEERLNKLVNTIETHILNYNLKMRLDSIKQKKEKQRRNS